MAAHKTGHPPGAPVYLCLSKLGPIPMSSHLGLLTGNAIRCRLLATSDEFGEDSMCQFNAHWSLQIRAQYFEIHRNGFWLQFSPNSYPKDNVFYRRLIGYTEYSNAKITARGGSLIPTGFYDVLSRNCQTTTKDLAKDIIRREHFDPKFAWPLDTVDFITNSLYLYLIFRALLVFATWSLRDLRELAREQSSIWDLISCNVGRPFRLLEHVPKGLVVALHFGCNMLLIAMTMQKFVRGISDCARIPSWLWRQWSRFQGGFPKMWFRLDRV